MDSDNARSDRRCGSCENRDTCVSKVVVAMPSMMLVPPMPEPIEIRINFNRITAPFEEEEEKYSKASKAVAAKAAAKAAYAARF